MSEGERTIILRGRESIGEEELERGAARSVITEEEGRKVLKIRWTTGKTSAGRLFGKYGREGRPDFFRLLFGAITGSLRENLGDDKGLEEFNRIRDSKNFKDSVQKIFDEMKRWFFDDVVPKHKLEPGDIFVITTELTLDLESGELFWNKDKTEVVYWVRSDRVFEKCKELGVSVEVEEVERMREKIESLSKELESLKSKYEQLVKEKKDIEHERDTLKIEVDTLKLENERLRGENEELKRQIEEFKRKLEELRRIIS
ncbi:MAG: transcription factor [Thermoprotei archaeon ex4572_64]|nr:MAG: transcription factor [Thermoprotei archaeon ex4572_64]